MRLIDADALTDELIKGIEADTDKSIQTPFAKGLGLLLCKALELQPTVDAEPVRHGMFIGTEYDGYADGNPVYYEWKCSECGCVFEEDEPTYRYCPNCGAKMDVRRRNPLDKVDRNIEIYKSRKRGEGFTEIAKKFNITPQRARQIFYKEDRIRLWKRKWGVERKEENE